MAKKQQSNGTGSLFKRGKKGSYYVQYYANGKRKSTRLLDGDGLPITDRRKAEAAAKTFLAPLRETSTIDQLKAVKAKIEGNEKALQQKRDAVKPPLPLTEVWEAYESSQNRPKSGASTLKRYRAVIKAFIDWKKEAYPDLVNMRDVTSVHAEAYAAHLETGNLSPSSFNIYINNLTTIWATLSKKADLDHNPFAWDKSTRTGEGVELPKMPLMQLLVSEIDLSTISGFFDRISSFNGNGTNQGDEFLYIEAGGTIYEFLDFTKAPPLLG